MAPQPSTRLSTGALSFKAPSKQPVRLGVDLGVDLGLGVDLSNAATWHFAACCVRVMCDDAVPLQQHCTDATQHPSP